MISDFNVISGNGVRDFARVGPLVRTALSTMSVTASAYAGHSFRIGAATAIAEAGLEDSVISLLGRWNSDAFLRYVRTLRETLAGFTARLAPASPTPSAQPRSSLARHRPFAATRGRVRCNTNANVVQHALYSVGQSDCSITNRDIPRVV